MRYLLFCMAVFSTIIFTLSSTTGLESAATFAQTRSSPDQSCDPVIETYIVGDFNGWDDETIYKMDNGQIWQQANYHYHYHYAYHPKVLIYPVKSGCHIKVDGDSDEGVNVIRLK